MSGLSYLVLKLIPKNLVSRILGKLAEYPFPSPLLQSLIQVYAQIFQVNLNEVKRPLSEMKTFDEFFSRQLKTESRPIDQTENAVVSPVDGTIAAVGKIDQGLLLQTKGIYYTLTDLVGKKEAAIFKEGYYVTIYLNPADYHRIHAPFQGTIREFSYFSGNLWPVNNWGVRHIGSLFCINERILTPLETEMGRIALIKVGAVGVGRISLTFSNFTSNQGYLTQMALPVIPAKKMEKGTEIGAFHIGSTVILLFEKERFTPTNLSNGKKVRMGEKIGLFSISPE